MRRISDSKQRVLVALAFVLEFYKVMMGSMLTLFVPHRCVEDVALPACTLSEVASRLVDGDDPDWVQRAAFLANATTLVMVVVLYGFEAYREDWCISNLDIDPSKPATNLDRELDAYPDLRRKSVQLNERYSRMSGVVAVAVAGNFAMSGVYLLGHQAGLTTLVSLVSYLLLLAIKLHQTYSISHASLRNSRSFSAYMVVQRTFNCVDEDVAAARAMELQPAAGALADQPEEVRAPEIC